MNKLGQAVVIVGLGLSLVGCGTQETIEDLPKKAANPTEKVEVAETKKEDVYFKDDTLKIDMATVKILSTEVLEPSKEYFREKPQLVFTYETTNDSKEPLNGMTTWIACFEATQEGIDTINKLEVGMTPQEEKYTSYLEHQLDDIKPGGTAKGIMAYDIDDPQAVVTLKATQGMAGKELGGKKIELK